MTFTGTWTDMQRVNGGNCSARCVFAGASLVMILTLVCSAPSLAREILVPLTACADRADRACVVGGVTVTRDARHLVRKRAGRTKVIKTYLIEGSLAGGETKPYALKFVQPITDYFAQTDHSGPIAHRGEIDGSPVVLTTRGQLLILTDGVQLEPIPNVVVVDERSGRSLARYYDPCTNLSHLNAQATTIWDELGRRCMNVKTGAKSENSCSRPARDSCGGVPSHFKPATAMTLKRLRELARDVGALQLKPNEPDGTFFGGDGWGVWPYRVPGTSFLVIYGYCGDCDESSYDLKR